MKELLKQKGGGGGDLKVQEQLRQRIIDLELEIRKQ